MGLVQFSSQRMDWKTPKGLEIRFLRGRLKFDDQDGYAQFPSAIVIFK